MVENGIDDVEELRWDPETGQFFIYNPETDEVRDVDAIA